MQQQTIRCDNCGFLTGYSIFGISRDDKYFDPAQLRLVEKEDISFSEVTNPDFRLTMQLYQRRSSRGDSVSHSHYTWKHCEEIQCTRHVWSHKPQTYSERIVFSSSVVQILKEIQTPRECPYYFEYIPGFSAMDHSVEQREFLRLERDLAFQKQLAFQSQITQWVAVGISLLAVLISVGAPLLINPPVEIIIEEPLSVVVPTSIPTVTPSSTPSITPEIE